MTTNPPVTAYADPEGEAPWAMQLVVRAEKNDPPSHTHTLEAAASATVLLLDRVEKSGTPQDKAAVERWLAGRIRKVVRRARGAAWTNATAVHDPLLVSHGTAQAAAYLPAPVDQVPAELSKLQVSGLVLDDHDHDIGIVFPDSRVQIFLNPTVELTTGKAAAQVAHAAQLTWMAGTGAGHAAWVASGAPVVVSTATVEHWEMLSKHAPVSITDAGFTEIPPGTKTCVATHRF